MVKTYKTGRLSWNPENERYGLKVGDAWVHLDFAVGSAWKHLSMVSGLAHVWK